MVNERAFLGTALHALVRGRLEMLRKALIEARVPGSNLHLDERDTPEEEVLQKIIYYCARINIREVWVANRRAHAFAATPSPL